MKPFRRLSTSEQLARHLRDEIARGTLKGALPGVQQLVRTLGVNSVAVAKAVRQLEHEGLVLYRGDRKSRQIVESSEGKGAPLKVGILQHDEVSGSRQDMLSIRQALMNAGYEVMVCPKSMQDLGMRVERVARAVQAMDVDAWVVGTGSREILEWFLQQKKPVFALHGRQMEFRTAGAAIRKIPVITSLIERLVGLGHHRIVLLTRETGRRPEWVFFERSFINNLEKHGLPTGRYNIPDWENTPDGLEEVIHSLFRATPPTTMLISDMELVHPIQIQLASMGIYAPRDLSLFCNDFEESFRWTRPAISHIRWNHAPAIRRVLKWAKNIAQGREDQRRIYLKAQLYEGGTIGPAKPGQ